MRKRGSEEKVNFLKDHPCQLSGLLEVLEVVLEGDFACFFWGHEEECRAGAWWLALEGGKGDAVFDTAVL